jgi:hypothetical protein
LEAGATTPVLAEAAAMPWRRRATERSLAKEGRVWTLWSIGVVVTFGLPAALLIWIQPLAFPVSAIFLGHGLAVLHIQARRGARGVKPIGSADGRAEQRALGLLGDLVGHDARELIAQTGLALECGRLGTWLVGQEGAILVRPGGHRVHCFCVRVGEADDLPPGDRVRSCFSPCARTRRDSPRWRTGTSRARPGACGWSCRSESAPPLSGRAADLLGEDSQAVHQLSALRR